MEGPLLRNFDHFIKQKGYTNRSEAVRDLIRDALIQQSWEEEDQIVAGSILLFYNHHQRNLHEELTKIQHDTHANIMATTHFHIDEANCLEIIIVKGKAKELQLLSNRMMSLKGVGYGKFTVALVEHMDFLR